MTKKITKIPNRRPEEYAELQDITKWSREKLEAAYLRVLEDTSRLRQKSNARKNAYTSLQRAYDILRLSTQRYARRVGFLAEDLQETEVHIARLERRVEDVTAVAVQERRNADFLRGQLSATTAPVVDVVEATNTKANVG